MLETTPHGDKKKPYKRVALLKVELVVRRRVAALSRQAVVSCGCLHDCRVAMARVQLADVEYKAGWVHVIVNGVSVLYHRGSGEVSVGCV